MTSSIPDVALLDREVNAYRFLYNYADRDGDGRISSQEAVQFLNGTGLQQHVLQQIWGIANPSNANYLTPNIFFVVLRLVSMSQAGHSPNLNIAVSKKELPLPRIEGVEIKSHKYHSYNPAPYEALYSGIFERVEKSHGNYLSGSEAINFFGTSGLHQDELRLVWELSDSDGDAMLTLPEFCVAMYLIHGRLAGENLPTELPEPMLKFLNDRKDPWIMSPTDRERYLKVFAQSARGNLIDGSSAGTILVQSGLPTPTLSKIWELCDRGKRGALDSTEFAAALHIINKVKDGKAIPNELPLQLMH
jgi:Ca2+-binding EF-hand superfamily protein